MHYIRKILFFLNPISIFKIVVGECKQGTNIWRQHEELARLLWAPKGEIYSSRIEQLVKLQRR